MLIEFKVANFQCFRDEVTLSLVPAGQDRSLRGNIWEGNRHRALKSAAIFGPNASGKSALLRALGVLQRFVAGSATEMTVGDPIPGIDPFRLAAPAHEQPSCFEVLVELDGGGYRYRIEATGEQVIREKLQHQDAAEGSRRLTLIDRDASRRGGSRATLHDRLGSPSRLDQIIEDTRENALVLSRAAERNVEVVVPIFNWFKGCLSYDDSAVGLKSRERAVRGLARLAAKDDHYLARLTELVRDADTGIVGLQTESADEDFSQMAWRDLGSALAEAKEGGSTLRKKHLASLLVRMLGKFRFFALHEGPSEHPVRFELEDESDGTLRYLHVVGRLLNDLQHGVLTVIDALDASLHPQLARRAVQLAHSPEYGRAAAQLIFSTHDTTLMDPSLMRRDQIFITQKNAQAASELYTLWDFERMPRKDAAWAKNYLAGRFGGVPAFGPALADIPQGDEPTKVEPSSLQSAEAE